MKVGPFLDSLIGFLLQSVCAMARMGKSMAAKSQELGKPPAFASEGKEEWFLEEMKQALPLTLFV